MTPSALDAKQVTAIARAAFYVSLSAGLDFLISQTSGTAFGVLTPVINVVLVTIKKVFTNPEG